MKKQLSLALLTLCWSGISFADFDVPSDAVKVAGTTNANAIYSVEVPNSNNQADYVSWFDAQAEAERKNVMTQWAKLHPSSQAQCIWVPGAFSFKKIDDSHYKVLCYAGKGGKALSHMMQYDIDYNYLPSGCMPDDGALNLHFKDAFSRNSTQAKMYYRQIVGSCQLQVRAHDMSSPQAAISAIYSLSPEAINKAVLNDDSLQPYLAKGADSKSVNSSKSGKPSSGSLMDDDGFSNPAATGKAN